MIRLTTILCCPLTLERYLIKCYHRRPEKKKQKPATFWANFLSGGQHSGHKCVEVDEQEWKETERGSERGGARQIDADTEMAYFPRSYLR